MAKVGFSPLISDARGSVAAVTFSRSRSGQYTRARVTPRNPKSGSQRAVRAGMTYCRTRWSTVLTDAQRQAWDLLAARYPKRSTIAGMVRLSGQQMHARCGIPAYYYFAWTIDNAPTDLTVNPPLSLAINSFTHAPFHLTITITGPEAFTNAWIVQVTKPLSAGIRKWTRAIVYIGKLTGGTVYPFDIAPWYTALGLPTPALGQRLGVMVHAFNYTNGAISQAFITDALAT